MGVLRSLVHSSPRFAAGLALWRRGLSASSFFLLVVLCSAVWPAAEDSGPINSAAVGSLVTAHQRAVIDTRGRPDAFTIVGVGGDSGGRSRDYRMEAWFYHADRVAVVFVDGGLLGTRDLESSECGPTTGYQPFDFALGMTVRQVEFVLFGKNSAARLDVPRDSPDYVGVSHGALQIGFENGLLVYADSSLEQLDDGAGDL